LANRILLFYLFFRKYHFQIYLQKKGDKGYFRIARGKNMCGIGRSAIYLCPDKNCRFSFSGVSRYQPTVSCQCGGEGFLGTSVCANQGNCYERHNGFYQCTSQRSIPTGWWGNRKSRIILFFLR